MFPFTIPVLTFLIALSEKNAGAEEAVAEFSFREHFVEFRNGDVRLAGSLLLPESRSAVPAVVFVHGAGRHTRRGHREVGGYFARQGIAALIYDKRGTGESGGVYESSTPYENLVNDALSGVDLLKRHKDIDDSQLGIWGLSQGAHISAVAASRTEHIQFVIVAGAEVADGMMTYYRDNLFRHFGHSENLRDVAEKGHLAQKSLHEILRNGFRLSPFAPRLYPPPDEYVHPAWSQVHQPVLAMWGQLDQNVPVGESVAGLKCSLAQAKNEKWKMLILPGASHDLGMSETGELKEKWGGYAPGALKMMTDWAHKVIHDPSHIDRMEQDGIAHESDVLSRLAPYEKLRWFGNAPVQAVLLVLFLTSFLSNTMVGIVVCFQLLFGYQQSAILNASNRGVNFKRAVCALNLLILMAFVVLMLSLMHQWRPTCPSILLHLPLFGAVSVIATIALMIVLTRTRGGTHRTVAGKLRGTFDVLCLILFVPYLLYWNLIGYHF